MTGQADYPGKSQEYELGMLIPGICAVRLLSNCISISGQRRAAEGSHHVSAHKGVATSHRESGAAHYAVEADCREGFKIYHIKVFMAPCSLQFPSVVFSFCAYPVSQNSRRYFACRHLAFKFVYRAFVTSTSHFRSRKLHTHK